MGSSMGSATRKRFIDFHSFLETVVVAEAKRRGMQTVALVLDNGPTHASKQLPRWVQELATASDGKLPMQLYWLPTNASWLDQIEIWFSLLQRKLLQPNHFCSLDELEQAILDFIAHYNRAAEPLKWSYTVEKLERKCAVSCHRGMDANALLRVENVRSRFGGQCPPPGKQLREALGYTRVRFPYPA